MQTLSEQRANVGNKNGIDYIHFDKVFTIESHVGND